MKRTGYALEQDRRESDRGLEGDGFCFVSRRYEEGDGSTDEAVD